MPVLGHLNMIGRAMPSICDRLTARGTTYVYVGYEDALARSGDRRCGEHRVCHGLVNRQEAGTGESVSLREIPYANEPNFLIGLPQL
jgi:hypothetical protein